MQLRQERDEKLAALRAQGKIIMTEEEREKDQMELENMLERARKDADELRKKEKSAAKAEGKEELGLIASDDESEDEEYVASGEEANEEDEHSEQSEMDVSGSEDEENAMEVDEEEEVGASNLLDNVAEEDPPEEPSDVEGVPAPSVSEVRRMGKKKRVIEDEDDDSDDGQTTTPAQTVAAAPAAAPDDSTLNDDLAAAFGFAAAPVAPMGLSQMFAGTMGASQTQMDTLETTTTSAAQDQDSMDVFRHNVPSAPLPTFDRAPVDESQDALVQDSQKETFHTQGTQTAPPQVAFDYTQAALASPAVTRMSQFSNIPSPSQDVGFGPRHSQAVFSGPQSTIDTVLLPVEESPIPQKRGRLQRRVMMTAESDADDDDPADVVVASTPVQQQTSIFDVMKKAAAKPAEPDFDRKKSGAKGMVDEQAEESEDEYAGLGGASGDDSDGEADEADKAMIDESAVKVDERRLAAFYA